MSESVRLTFKLDIVMYVVANHSQHNICRIWMYNWIWATGSLVPQEVCAVNVDFRNRAWKWWRQKWPGNSKSTSDFYFGSTKVWLCYCLSVWVHNNPGDFFSPPVVTPPLLANPVNFNGYITLLWVRRLEMCLDPYKNWTQVDSVFEFLKMLLCCDVPLSSPIVHVLGNAVSLEWLITLW